MDGFGIYPGFERQNEREALRKTVTAVSLAFIVYFIASIFVISPFVCISGGSVAAVLSLFREGETGEQILNFVSSELFEKTCTTIVYVLSMLVALAAVRLFTGKKKLFGIELCSSDEFVYAGKNRDFVFANILPLTFLSMLVSTGMSYFAALTGWTATDTAEAFPTEMAAAAVYFIQLVILPPVFEELLFRGALIRVLLPHGRCIAVIFSAVFFGGLHGQGQGVAYAFATGIILALAAVESGSLVPSMTIHAINNLIVFSQEFLCSEFPALEDYIQNVMSLLIVFLGLISIYFVFGRKNRLCADVRENRSMTNAERLKAAVTPAFLVFAAIVLLFAVFYRVTL